MLNLTGATVYLMAKESLSDEDSDALLDVSQTEHSAPTAGETTLRVDLSELPAVYFSNGGKLFGSLWVVDGTGQRIPYGGFLAIIAPSAKWKPEAE